MGPGHAAVPIGSGATGFAWAGITDVPAGAGRTDATAGTGMTDATAGAKAGVGRKPQSHTTSAQIEHLLYVFLVRPSVLPSWWPLSRLPR